MQQDGRTPLPLGMPGQEQGLAALRPPLPPDPGFWSAARRRAGEPSPMPTTRADF